MSLTMETSVSFLKYELASTIEQAVTCAVETVLKETARVVGIKLAAARTAAAESHRENQSLRERLDVSEGELKATRYYMTAAEKNIKQCLLLNHNQPRSGALGPGSEESLFLFPPTASGSPSNMLTTRGPKSFRGSSTRSQFSKSLPSVGLCLPTVQHEWPRSSESLTRIRTSSSTVSSTNPSRTSKVPQLEVGNSPHHTEEDTEEYKVCASGGEDSGIIQHKQEGGTVAAEVPRRTPDITNFELEMGQSHPAGNVNDLGLIQVLDEVDEVKRTVKIENDPDVPSMMESQLPESSQQLPQMPAHIDNNDGDNDGNFMGFVPPPAGDPVALSLLQAGPSYTWPHLHSQSLDS
ncbi:unnamed protein product [Coregonus sp. 'balchen']|nr:unnamed protein product [Coregonus sp. 'balchen']